VIAVTLWCDRGYIQESDALTSANSRFASPVARTFLAQRVAMLCPLKSSATEARPTLEATTERLVAFAREDENGSRPRLP